MDDKTFLEALGSIIIPTISSFLGGVLMGLLLPVLRKVHRVRTKYYRTVWKVSHRLKPSELLEIRSTPECGFRTYYYRRPVDDLTRARIEKGKNVLITGRPACGKTRTLYEVLKQSSGLRVTIPRVIDIPFTDLRVPILFWPFGKRILVLDDIDRFLGRNNFDHMLKQFLHKDVAVVASCRTTELPYVRSALEGKFADIFSEPIEIPDVSDEELVQIVRSANETGGPINIPDSFDHTIGSLFIPLDTIRQRIAAMESQPKWILMAMKRLYAAGVYKGREVFSIDRIKRVCRTQHYIQLKKYEWDEVISNLQKQAFVKRDGETVTIEECYLQKVIEDEFDILENLHEMLNIFSDDAEASFMIGCRADEIAEHDIQRVKLVNLAIDAYQSALKEWTIGVARENYAMTQHNLAHAYQILAEVKNTAHNCKKATIAYENALKINTLTKAPRDFALTRINMSDNYRILASVEQPKENCVRAIEAAEDAVAILKAGKYRTEYATAQMNLGNAYSILAEATNTADNFKKAIAAYEETLKIHTFEKSPDDYAIAQNNLGSTYRALAEIEDKAKNCKKAIAVCEIALKIRTLDRLPRQYATTKINLGDAFRILAQEENTADNCNKAIAAYKEALKVNTVRESSMQYAYIKFNMGMVDIHLAMEEQLGKFLNAGRESLKESLRVFTQLGMKANIKQTQGILTTLEELMQSLKGSEGGTP